MQFFFLCWSNCNATVLKDTTVHVYIAHGNDCHRIMAYVERRTLQDYDILEESSLRLVDSLYNEDISCEKGIVLTEKGNLKWFGLFEELRDIISELKMPSGKWSTPRGGSKQYDGEDILLYIL